MRALPLRRLVTAAVVVPALALAGCGREGPPGSIPVTTEEGPATSSASGGRERGGPIDGESPPMDYSVADLLDSAHDELGEIDVAVLMLYTDHARLMYRDPTDPAATIRLHYSDATWDDPVRIPHRATGPSLSLEQIDPELLEALIEATPDEIGMADAEFDHAGIGADDAGEPEYLIAVIEGDSLGTVSYRHDGEVRDVNDYR